jgi:branched-chain amino acid aminotransferase
VAGLRPEEETDIEPEAILDAGEAFLTNSLMEVMPLTRLNGQAVGSGRPGPLTERLRRLYRELALGEEPPSNAGTTV